jgi:protein tyrosine/serine phosphatase
MNRREVIKAIGIGMGLIILPTGCLTTRGVRGTTSIENYGIVNSKLSRGAVPTKEGYEQLKKDGVVRVIDLRGPSEVSADEFAWAGNLGIDYNWVPLSNVAAPSKEDVERILNLIDTIVGKVFVHYVYGCDRTGTIVACYRIRNCKWTAERAQKEADYYGMSNWEVGMKHFIKHFK